MDGVVETGLSGVEIGLARLVKWFLFGRVDLVERN